MRLLVTGSSGFIGTNFCEGLHDSPRFDLVGVDIREPPERFPRVEYRSVDLRDRHAVQQLVLAEEPEVIVHLAAQARVGPSLVDPVVTYDLNVLATINLLDSALALPRRPEIFVYASSETVYGPADVHPTPEHATLRPQSAYAASKAASEHLVRNANGCPSLILRSAMGYGPRSNPREQVVAKFLTKALRDDSIRFPQGLSEGLHPTRDINHVHNYLDGTQKALEANVTGTFNIGSGRETSILELAYKIVDLAGSGSVTFDPGFAYRPGEVGLRTWLDTRRAEEAFGYRPLIPLDAGLHSTLEWYAAHPDLWSDIGRPLAQPAIRGGGGGR